MILNRLFLLLFPVLLLTTIIEAQTEYSIKLSRHTGVLPLPMHTYVGSRYYSSIKSENVPDFIKDYKCYSIPFHGWQNGEGQHVDSISAICGMHEGYQIVVIDADDNGDLRDDKVFRFKYDKEKFLRIAQRGLFPDSFKIDPWTKLDRYPGNEIFLNYEIWDGKKEYPNQVLVEVIPNFILFPNPSDVNYEDQLSEFDYTFMLALAEYRTGEVTIAGSKYQLFFQQGSSTKIFDEVQCYVRKDMIGMPQIDFEEIVFYPGQKLIVGDAVFDLEIDYRGENARLIEFDSRSNYLAKIENNFNQIIPFNGESFTDNSEVKFPEQNKKPTLVHFWGSWCGPCKVDMPNLIEIWSEYGDSINMIGVAAEQLIDLDQLNELAGRLGLVWPQITDDISKDESLSQSYFISAFPTYLIASDSGKIMLRSNEIGEAEEILQDLFTR